MSTCTRGMHTVVALERDLYLGGDGPELDDRLLAGARLVVDPDKPLHASAIIRSVR